MKQEFNQRHIATIKRTAQNVAPIVAKKQKVLTKIEQLKVEFEALTAEQESWEAAIKTMTGGYTTEDLVSRIVETTINAEGKEIKTTKYVLKYPETVVPVETVAEGDTPSDFDKNWEEVDNYNNELNN
jgi:hypothetical protein